MPQLSASARTRLQNHSWPGNVRELDNVIQRALIVKSGDKIDCEDILLENLTITTANEHSIVIEGGLDVAGMEDDLGFKNELKSQEHKIILETLAACGGSRKGVSEKLGISPRTLRYKIAKMRERGIEIPA